MGRRQAAAEEGIQGAETSPGRGLRGSCQEWGASLAETVEARVLSARRPGTRWLAACTEPPGGGGQAPGRCLLWPRGWPRSPFRASKSLLSFPCSFPGHLGPVLAPPAPLTPPGVAGASGPSRRFSPGAGRRNSAGGGNRGPEGPRQCLGKRPLGFFAPHLRPPSGSPPGMLRGPALLQGPDPVVPTEGLLGGCMTGREKKRTTESLPSAANKHADPEAVKGSSVRGRGRGGGGGIKECCSGEPGWTRGRTDGLLSRSRGWPENPLSAVRWCPGLCPAAPSS